MFCSKITVYTAMGCVLIPWFSLASQDRLVLNKPPGWEVDQDKGCSEAPEAAAARLSQFMCLG